MQVLHCLQTFMLGFIHFRIPDLTNHFGSRFHLIHFIGKGDFLLYRILLLLEKSEEDCRVKDFLQISGCTVKEALVERDMEYRELVVRMDLVILYCRHAEHFFGVCKEVREATQKPLLILTKDNDEWAKIKMFQAGVNDYLVEPIPQGELVARVKGQIACFRRLTGSFGYINNRDLEIEVFNRKVKLCGKEAKMTPREFDVLLFLAQNPEEVLTKEDIFHAIWDAEEGEGCYNGVAI